MIIFHLSEHDQLFLQFVNVNFIAMLSIMILFVQLLYPFISINKQYFQFVLIILQYNFKHYINSNIFDFFLFLIIIFIIYIIIILYILFYYIYIISILIIILIFDITSYYLIISYDTHSQENQFVYSLLNSYMI